MLKPKDLQLIRKVLGKSQSELAALLGLSARTMQSYEQGLRVVSPHIQQLLYLLLARQKRPGKAKALSCWEARDCDPAVRDRCPAFLYGAGDICWLITGTFCRGKKASSLKSKLAKCQGCPVVKRWLKS